MRRLLASAVALEMVLGGIAVVTLSAGRNVGTAALDAPRRTACCAGSRDRADHVCDRGAPAEVSGA